MVTVCEMKIETMQFATVLNGKMFNEQKGIQLNLLMFPKKIVWLLGSPKSTINQFNIDRIFFLSYVALKLRLPNQNLKIYQDVKIYYEHKLKTRN